MKRSTLWPDIKIQTDSDVPTLFLNNRPCFGWTANRPFLPSHVEADERLHGAGSRHIHIDTTCSEWWIKANPDEAQIYADGSRERSFQRCDKRATPSQRTSARQTVFR